MEPAAEYREWKVSEDGPMHLGKGGSGTICALITIKL